jgi:hypothetical protein
MTHDKEHVQAVVEELSPEARTLLTRVLEIENEKLYVKTRDVTDAIMDAIRGLIP